MSDQLDASELRELYATVELGLDVQAFLRTPVGKYLWQRASDERVDALADLVDVSPADTEAVRALQSTIKRADSILFWLNEAIEAGKNAEAQLEPRGD
jgi:hypothetical protein